MKILINTLFLLAFLGITTIVRSQNVPADMQGIYTGKATLVNSSFQKFKCSMQLTIGADSSSFTILDPFGGPFLTVNSGNARFWGKALSFGGPASYPGSYYSTSGRLQIKGKSGKYQGSGSLTVLSGWVTDYSGTCKLKKVGL